MKLMTVGLNHKTAPLKLRERLSFSPEKAKEALRRVAEEALADEAMILSTCNRVEIYGASSDPERAASRMKEFLCRFHDILPSELQSHFYDHTHDQAVLHGFRVATGLDSMVLGESQILGQMKDAYRLAREAGSVGTALHRYFHRVFRVAKKVRTETEISSLPVSVSYVAVMLAKKIFGTLEGRKALLVGAGKMSELAARHLKGQGSPEIWVTNRNFERAQAMADACAGHAVHFNDFLLSLPQVDVVITSTSSEGYLLTPEHIHQAMRLRKNRPMFLIDIAVPRNVDPAVNRIFNVYLYDLDDLQNVVEDNLKERREKARQAEALVAEEARVFLKGLKTLSIAPTIELLSKKFDRMRRAELEKALARLKNLTPEQKEILEALTSSIVNKILHEPLLALKGEAGDPEYEGAQVSGEASASGEAPASEHALHEIIQKLFRLDEVIE